MKLHCFTLFRRISTFRCRQAKEKPLCTPKSEVKSVCLYDNPIDKGCELSEVDPEWSAPEAVATSDEPRIVVIGAGPAGLIAADRLVAAGLKDVIVLEASCRAGGRLRSCWAGDTVVELGLSRDRPRTPLDWGHPLLKLAGDLIGPPVGADPTIGLLDPPLSLGAMIRAYRLVKGLQAEDPARMAIPGYKSLRVEQINRTLSPEEKEDVSRAMAAIYALMGPRPKVVEDSFCPYVVAPGGAHVPVGECRHLLPLTRRLGPERLLLRKEAVSVRWGTVTPDQRPRAVVRCRDGSEFPAEFVLLTCSLGCLKRGQDEMFSPPLPASKVQAINKSAFLAENKVFLVFQQPIWSWTSKPVEFTFKTPPNGAEGWTKGVTEMRKVEGSERVIGVTVAGNEALQMERQSIQDVTDSLHRFLGKELCAEIPRPEKVIRSTWCDDRHTLGLRSKTTDAEGLAAPLPSPDALPPVLLFAGEATVPGRSGIEAATISGLREAQRLLGLVRRLPSARRAERTFCPKICPPIG